MVNVKKLISNDMTRKEGTLVPMNGGGDKRNINANYRKILDAGFRCNRKEHCYQHPDGFKIAWFTVANYKQVWKEI